MEVVIDVLFTGALLVDYDGLFGAIFDLYESRDGNKLSLIADHGENCMIIPRILCNLY